MRNNAMKAAIGHRTRSKTLRLRKARKALKVAIREVKNRWIQQKCDAMNSSNSKNGTAGCWKALKEIKKRSYKEATNCKSNDDKE